MRHKTVEVVDTKVEESGEVVAQFSAFNNVDLVGDRILPGAFKRTLTELREKGDPVPVVVSHDWGDLWAHVGYADPENIRETKEGVVAMSRFDLDDNPLARQAHKLLKRRSLKAFSFGYTVPEGGEELNDDGVNEISDLDLIEFGPTLKGANPDAEVLAVKSALESANPATTLFGVTTTTNATGGNVTTASVESPDSTQKGSVPAVEDASEEEPADGPTPGAIPRRRELNRAMLNAHISTTEEEE